MEFKDNLVEWIKEKIEYLSPLTEDYKNEDRQSFEGEFNAYNEILDWINENGEETKVTFTGEPISGKQGFDDVACDKVEVITSRKLVKSGVTYHAESLQDASDLNFAKIDSDSVAARARQHLKDLHEILPNVDTKVIEEFYQIEKLDVKVTEGKDGFIYVQGKTEQPGMISCSVPTEPRLFPEIDAVDFKMYKINNLCITAPKDADISDGYHTMSELYDHRNLLFINLAQRLVFDENFLAWRTKVDDNWFILTICPLDEPCEQISYHIDMSLYDKCDFSRDEPRDFDGHTSACVLERLKSLI